jgi:hypothetical protein
MLLINNGVKGIWKDEFVACIKEEQWYLPEGLPRTTQILR